jgi:hypothetical protein
MSLHETYFFLSGFCLFVSKRRFFRGGVDRQVSDPDECQDGRYTV